MRRRVGVVHDHVVARPHHLTVLDDHAAERAAVLAIDARARLVDGHLHVFVCGGVIRRGNLRFAACKAAQEHQNRGQGREGFGFRHGCFSSFLQ